MFELTEADWLEQEIYFSSKMSEVACFIRDLDEGRLVDLMKDVIAISGAQKIIDVKVAAQFVLETACQGCDGYHGSDAYCMAPDPGDQIQNYGDIRGT